MKHRTPLTVAAAVACLAIPAVATAHDATVTCTPDGALVVTPDYQHLNPTWTVTDATVVVTWSDGYRVVHPIPTGCATPTPTPGPEPTPTPTPQPTPQPTPTPQPPATCTDLLARYPKAGPARRAAWGCPANPVKKPPLKVHRRELTIRAHGCVPGGRAYTIRRTRVTWTRGGQVIRTKWSRTYRVPGIVCHIPAVTG